MATSAVAIPPRQVKAESATLQALGRFARVRVNRNGKNAKIDPRVAFFMSRNIAPTAFSVFAVFREPT
jgi:hypothetical protein